MFGRFFHVKIKTESDRFFGEARRGQTNTERGTNNERFRVNIGAKPNMMATRKIITIFFSLAGD